MSSSGDSLIYSALARSDLIEIASYTLRTWGEGQADRYLNALDDCCTLLLRRSMLGRPCDILASGLRRIEQGQHVIFYCLQPSGVLIVRILHCSMIPEGRIGL